MIADWVYGGWGCGWLCGALAFGTITLAIVTATLLKRKKRPNSFEVQPPNQDRHNRNE